MSKQTTLERHFLHSLFRERDRHAREMLSARNATVMEETCKTCDANGTKIRNERTVELAVEQCQTLDNLIDQYINLLKNQDKQDSTA